MPETLIDGSLAPLLLLVAVVTGVAAALSFLLLGLSRRAAASTPAPGHTAPRKPSIPQAPQIPPEPAPDHDDLFETAAAPARPSLGMLDPWVVCETCGHGYRRGAAACPECARRAAEADQVRRSAAGYAIGLRIVGVISLVLAVASVAGYAWMTDSAQRRASQRMVDDARRRDDLRKVMPPEPDPFRRNR